MLLKYETLNEKEILSLFNDGKMPENDDQEFPSEKAATFEEAKKALEAKEAEQNDGDATDDANPSEVADDVPTTTNEVSDDTHNED